MSFSPGDPPLFPLFLKLAGKRCVVIGGGTIGARRARELLAAGARVTVISPVFHADVPAEVERVERCFERGDTAGALLVVAATGVHAVDDEVVADADENGALLNVVDRAALSDFYSAAVVRRGPLTVAIGTSGASPTLSRVVRDHIDRILPRDLGVLADVLGRIRPRLLQRHPLMQARIAVLTAFVERAWERFLPSNTEPSSPTLPPHEAESERSSEGELAFAIERAAVEELDLQPGIATEEAACTSP